MPIYWTNSQAPLRTTPGGTIKILDIPIRSKVNLTGNTQRVMYSGKLTLWDEAEYEDSKGLHVGWSYAGFFEPYQYNYPVDVVDIRNQTPSKFDPLQYLTWLGNQQVNMCGEICACRIAGDNTDDFLSRWAIQSPNVYKSVFGSGRARGTGSGELADMLSVYGWSKTLPAPSTLLRDPLLGREINTPYRLQELLVDNYVIIGTRLNTQTGKLNGGGVGHWVVLETMTPNGIDDGFCTVFNPFMNRIEPYSFGELRASFGYSIAGVCAPRIK